LYKELQELEAMLLLDLMVAKAVRAAVTVLDHHFQMENQLLEVLLVAQAVQLGTLTVIDTQTELQAVCV
jgi:hypothetical protein